MYQLSVSVWLQFCLKVGCFQPFLVVSGELFIMSSCISSNTSIQISVTTCHRWIRASNSGHTLLDWHSLASHCSQYAGRYSLSVSHAVARHTRLLDAQRCMPCRKELSSLISQSMIGAILVSRTKVYQQCWKEWTGWCAQEDVPNNAISSLH